MTGAEESCYFCGNCISFIRPECGDSNGRGVNGEREGRTRNTKSGRTTKGEERDRMLSVQPICNMHAANCYTWRCWVGGGRDYPTGKKATLKSYGCDITNESCSLSLLLQSLQMVLGHTQAWFHMCAHIIACCRFPKRTCKHKPLCCRSRCWGSLGNASWETCPAQTVVSCPAERKITTTFILVNVDPQRFCRFRVKVGVFT